MLLISRRMSRGLHVGADRRQSATAAVERVAHPDDLARDDDVGQVRAVHRSKRMPRRSGSGLEVSPVFLRHLRMDAVFSV